jgi:hypothetical protein
MNENPLVTNVLEPFRLVLRFAECYYCKSSEYDDTLIGTNFGIRHCPNHKAWAIRDCNAYLHSLERIPVYASKNNPVLQAFVDILTNNSIHVLRTSGVYEPGWRLYTGVYHGRVAYIQRLNHTTWCIPMIHTASLSYKHVPIESLLCEENADLITRDQVTAILAILNYGVYKDDFDEHEKAKLSSNDSIEVNETPNIVAAFVEGLGECRVFLIPKELELVDETAALAQSELNHPAENPS